MLQVFFLPPPPLRSILQRINDKDGNIIITFHNFHNEFFLFLFNFTNKVNVVCLGGWKWNYLPNNVCQKLMLLLLLASYLMEMFWHEKWWTTNNADEVKCVHIVLRFSNESGKKFSVLISEKNIFKIST